MSKVYPITTGEYDDFDLIGIASSEEKVQEFMSRFPGEKFNPSEPMEIDDFPEVPEGKYPYTVQFDENKNMMSVCVLDLTIGAAMEIKNHPINIASIGGSPILYVSLWAKSIEEAMELAKDMVKDVVVELKKSNGLSEDMGDTGVY